MAKWRWYAHLALFLLATWGTAMAARLRRQQEPEKAALIAALKDSLGTTLGARLPVLEKLVGPHRPVALAIAWLIFYGTAAGLVLWWSTDGRMPVGGHAKLAVLIVWSWLHFAVLIAIIGLATRRVLDIVRRDILPFASDGYADSVVAALAREHASSRFRLEPYAVAALGAAASVWTIRGEIDPVWWTAAEFPFDLLLWSATVFGQALLAMRVVETAALPRLFAAALERDREALYPPRPDQSPLVQGLATLNRTLLTSWTCVFLVLATVMLLVLLPDPFGLSSHSHYLFILIPLVGFFSLGRGVLVYLQSEATIGTVVRRCSMERADELQQAIIPLLNKSEAGDEKAAARLERLTQLHDQTIAGGRYGSRLGIAFGVTLPFMLPVIALIEKLLLAPP